jgi:hypothetical protein
MEVLNMYFVFEDVIQSWRGSAVRARIEGEPPMTQPHWWHCIPLFSPLPLITFTVRQGAPLWDNMFTGTIFELYSVKLISVLSATGVRFETFPARVVYHSSRKDVETEYKIFHLLESYPCIDYNLSEIEDDLIDGDQMIIKKLVLRNEFLQQKKQFFRLDEMRGIVLIHQELKDLIELNNIQGCRFTPLDEYRRGTRIFNKSRTNKGQ